MRKNILILSSLAVLAMALSLAAGCGGSSPRALEGNGDTGLLLKEAGQAVSKASSYRINGTMQVQSQGSQPGQDMNITETEQGEVQQSQEGVKQHWVLSSGDMKQESYTIGQDYYAYVEGKGWMHTSVGSSQAPNGGLGVVDIQQLGLMADMAQELKTFEQNSDSIGISFRLGEDFFKASFASAGQGVSQEWLDSAQQLLSGLEANVRMWLLKDSMLVDRVEMDSDMDMGAYGSFHLSVSVKIDGYGEDMQVVLPEAAKSAQEVSGSPGQ